MAERNSSPPSTPATPPEADPAAITKRVLVRAAVYGMRTEHTDWDKVGTFVARSQQTTATLAREVSGQPLRAIPPRATPSRSR
ncbi:MAG TPA: hypothetical protein VMP67_02945 [Candidatus Limnocylindria bacterium]|nr:hypothetical protein [Candidatus Limnocylindria bacterium]